MEENGLTLCGFEASKQTFRALKDNFEELEAKFSLHAWDHFGRENPGVFRGDVPILAPKDLAQSKKLMQIHSERLLLGASFGFLESS